MRGLWDKIPAWLQDLIKGGTLLTVWGVVSFAAAEKIVKETIKEDWFVDKALRQINENVIGSTYQANFHLGRKGDPTDYSIQIYSSRNQKVELNLKVRHYESGPLRKAEILVNGNPVPSINIGGSKEYKKTIDLTGSINEARSRGEHDFSKNIQTITFRIDPNQPTRSSILLEVLITTVGISKRYDMETEE